MHGSSNFFIHERSHQESIMPVSGMLRMLFVRPRAMTLVEPSPSHRREMDMLFIRTMLLNTDLGGARDVVETPDECDRFGRCTMVMETQSERTHEVSGVYSIARMLGQYGGLHPGDSFSAACVDSLLELHDTCSELLNGGAGVAGAVSILTWLNAQLVDDRTYLISTERATTADVAWACLVYHLHTENGACDIDIEESMPRLLAHSRRVLARLFTPPTLVFESPPGSPADQTLEGDDASSSIPETKSGDDGVRPAASES